MQANKILSSSLLKTGLQSLRRVPTASVWSAARIGNREWVGYGVNGQANYVDRIDYPFPAVRFRENTAEVLVCRCVCLNLDSVISFFFSRHFGRKRREIGRNFPFKRKRISTAQAFARLLLKLTHLMANGRVMSV